MGIKAFHIFFISVSASLFLWLGLGRASLDGGIGAAGLLESGASVLLSALLVVYGVAFLRKLKGIGYL